MESSPCLIGLVDINEVVSGRGNINCDLSVISCGQYFSQCGSEIESAAVTIIKIVSLRIVADRLVRNNHSMRLAETEHIRAVTPFATVMRSNEYARLLKSCKK